MNPISLPGLAFLFLLSTVAECFGFVPLQPYFRKNRRIKVVSCAKGSSSDDPPSTEKKKIVIIGAGWGGLSAAHALAKSSHAANLDVTIVEAAPRVGGLVRDGFPTINNTALEGEAGQHGFWDNYHNIFRLLDEIFPDRVDEILTDYAEQGQYSPRGLEAVWPVYRRSMRLPTGLGQALYTKFVNLSPLDRATALPMVLAFSEFDDSEEAWAKYDNVSFRDLCIKLGVSRKCYEEVFEPMVLTGLFAPGAECSAAAALGMAYFFVLRSQNSFDVRWCRGNIGRLIFDPWMKLLKEKGVKFQMDTRVKGFELQGSNDNTISKVLCSRKAGDRATNDELILDADAVLFSVGGAALNAIVRGSSELAKHSEFRKFSNLRGTGVLATRLFLDTVLDTPYSANACWGFDKGVGMTMFDITKLHGNSNDTEEGNGKNNSLSVGSIIEIDYYHAASLLVMTDEQIVQKAKKDLDTILGYQSRNAQVLDAAIVRLPQAVNWYSPGSYSNMPNVQSKSIPNVYFCGDIVRSRHGSWSQEKAYVTGIEAANRILGRKDGYGIIPLEADEPHVSFGRELFSVAKSVAGMTIVPKYPSIVDFLW
ncbi:hypothetical protein HJC23_005445 [Cyclotella cryptica]|uniref:Amine oxidase domain-containing protein n=1 Tax=Cyclotella cryptica TaxID=29204 RepID=A0ABD3P2X1_9STRA|eukprot:CCRYP_017915-RA/>CCRYP_017915-RA protein AED:0.01 eAED:-0.01 QI:0/-1/0/1/-1/1/1/0/591